MQERIIFSKVIKIRDVIDSTVRYINYLPIPRPT